MAALSQEDIDRVSTIYFTQEMIKEEEKGEDTEFYTPANTMQKTHTQSDAFVTAQSGTIPESANDTFRTAQSRAHTTVNLPKSDPSLQAAQR